MPSLLSSASLSPSHTRLSEGHGRRTACPHDPPLSLTPWKTKQPGGNPCPGLLKFRGMRTTAYAASNSEIRFCGANGDRESSVASRRNCMM